MRNILTNGSIGPHVAPINNCIYQIRSSIIAAAYRACHRATAAATCNNWQQSSRPANCSTPLRGKLNINNAAVVSVDIVVAIAVQQLN